jgi:hypothetical protein
MFQATITCPFFQENHFCGRGNTDQIGAIVVVIAGSWIYNYRCNQYLSPLTLWVQIPLRRYNIMWSSLSVTHDRSVVFSSFLQQYNWPPWYNWNVIESGFKHHKSKPPKTWSNEMFVKHRLNLHVYAGKQNINQIYDGNFNYGKE